MLTETFSEYLLVNIHTAEESKKCTSRGKQIDWDLVIAALERIEQDTKPKLN